MTFDLPRRLTAEGLGTALLVATIVGSGIMAVSLSHDVGIQLLGNTLPTGAMLVVLITIFGPVSGAHLIRRFRLFLPSSATSRPATRRSMGLLKWREASLARSSPT